MLWALLALIRSGGTLFMLSNRCQHESCSRQPTIAGRLCDKVAGDVLRIPWAWIASFLGQIDHAFYDLDVHAFTFTENTSNSTVARAEVCCAIQ